MLEQDEWDHDVDEMDEDDNGNIDHNKWDHDVDEEPGINQDSEEVSQ